LEEFQSKNDRRPKAQRSTTFDHIEKLLEEGNAAGAMDALDKWLEGKPRTDFTDRLRAAAKGYRNAEAALTLREAALLKELAPIEAERAKVLSDLESNPYYRERKGWFDQLRYGEIGKPGALICFPPETMVLCEGGARPIGDLGVGQVVHAYDAGTQTPVLARVTATIRGWAPYLMNITFSDGGSIRATRRHRFFEPVLKDWLPARCLRPNSAVLRSDGAVVYVVSAELDERESRTCNLEVDPHHCYFAGDLGYLVHNDEEEYVSHFESKVKRQGKIYVVREKATGQIIYVGKTYDAITTRWNAHLRNKKKNWSNDTHEIEVIKEKQMTDFEIAVWEEHFIRLHGGLKEDNPRSLLINERYEITAAKFAEFRHEHNPCL
jgi:hypothetical protein